MWCAQGLALAALTISLSTYGLDCLAMSTPDEAMECCKAMRCHYRKHGGQNSQDCCKTTPQMHAVPTRPVAAQKIASPSITLAVLRAISHSQLTGSSQYVIAPHSHDPPSKAACILRLRV